MNEWMNESGQTQEVSSTVQVTSRKGVGGLSSKGIWMCCSQRASYLHHFCSTGTGSARRSPDPRRTPHRTWWSPSVWSTSLAQGSPASSPPQIWLQWPLIWVPRWGSHWRLDARFHWEWDGPSSPPPGPYSGRSSLRLEMISPSLV